MLNQPQDIHSLLAFLRLEPLCHADVFAKSVLEPIQKHKMVGLENLRAALACVCLRRTKQAVMQHIQLMPKTGKT
jgi:SWI/SNF-related matrix-associated actin-dependent regulator of chromatin subfamily A3